MSTEAVYFLRNLGSFKICRKFFDNKTEVERPVGTVTSKNLNQLRKKGGSVLGIAPEPLELIVQRRTLHMFLNIWTTLYTIYIYII